MTTVNTAVVRAEANAEHQDRRQRRRAGPKASQGGSDVRQQVVKGPGAPGIADVFLDPLHSAEGQQGLAPSRGAVGPEANPLLDLAVEVEAKLFVELPLLTAATKHRPQAFGKIGPGAHRGFSVTRTARIPLTAAEARRQVSISASS